MWPQLITFFLPPAENVSRLWVFMDNHWGLGEDQDLHSCPCCHLSTQLSNEIAITLLGLQASILSDHHWQALTSRCMTPSGPALFLGHTGNLDTASHVLSAPCGLCPEGRAQGPAWGLLHLIFIRLAMFLLLPTFTSFLCQEQWTLLIWGRISSKLLPPLILAKSRVLSVPLRALDLETKAKKDSYLFFLLLTFPSLG